MRRSFPLRPKSAGFENGVWIEVDEPLLWTQRLESFGWRFVSFSSDQFGIFEYRPGPAVLLDVAYRQVVAFQRWSNSQPGGTATLNPNGVFDAFTQVAADEMLVGADL